MFVLYFDDCVLVLLQEVMEDEYLVLLDIFVFDFEECLCSLYVVFQVGDVQVLWYIVYSFKGGSSNMGVVFFVGYCKELEESVRCGDL